MIAFLEPCVDPAAHWRNILKIGAAYAGSDVRVWRQLVQPDAGLPGEEDAGFHFHFEHEVFLFF